jgi:hypothetical protein
MKTPGRDRLLRDIHYVGAALTFVAALGAIAATTHLSTQHHYLLLPTLAPRQAKNERKVDPSPLW